MKFDTETMKSIFVTLNTASFDSGFIYPKGLELDLSNRNGIVPV
jgi:hypothetical protein